MEVSALGRQLEGVEEKVDMISGTLNKKISDLADSVVNTVHEASPVVQAVQGAIQGALQQDKAEELEIEQRKRNVIVHGVPESSADNADQRMDDDLTVLSAMFQEVSVEDARVESVVRLGRRSNDPTHSPRPMKVILDSVDNKVRLLRNAKNLREKQEGGWARIFVHQDLTPKQREARKPLVAELKQRKANGETDLVIFNGKVVQKRRPQSANAS